MKIERIYNLSSTIDPRYTKAVSDGKWYNLKRTIIVKEDDKIVIATSNIFDRMLYHLFNLFKYNYLKICFEGKDVKILTADSLKQFQNQTADKTNAVRAQVLSQPEPSVSSVSEPLPPPPPPILSPQVSPDIPKPDAQAQRKPLSENLTNLLHELALTAEEPGKEIPINHSIAAHGLGGSFIQGAELGGERLEGMRSILTNQYFLQSIERVTAQEPGYAEDVAPLKTGLEQVVETAQASQKIAELHPDADWETRASLFTEWLQTKIGDIPVGESLLLPGGWQGKQSPGHAMLYEITREKEDVYSMRIYNTGGGLQFHPSLSEGNREKLLQRIDIPNLNLNEITNPLQWHKYYEMQFAPNREAPEELNENIVYHWLSHFKPQSSDIISEAVKSHPDSSDYRRPQRGGVCTFDVILLYAKKKMKSSPGVYQSLRGDVRELMLKDYEHYVSDQFDEGKNPVEQLGVLRHLRESADVLRRETMRQLDKVYRGQHQNLKFDPARRSPIEASRSDRGSPSQIGKGDEEDRLGKVAAGQISSFDAGYGISPVPSQKIEQRISYLNRLETTIESMIATCHSQAASANRANPVSSAELATQLTLPPSEIKPLAAPEPVATKETFRSIVWPNPPTVGNIKAFFEGAYQRESLYLEAIPSVSDPFWNFDSVANPEEREAIKELIAEKLSWFYDVEYRREMDSFFYTEKILAILLRISQDDPICQNGFISLDWLRELREENKGVFFTTTPKLDRQVAETRAFLDEFERTQTGNLPLFAELSKKGLDPKPQYPRINDRLIREIEKHPEAQTEIVRVWRHISRPEIKEKLIERITTKQGPKDPITDAMLLTFALQHGKGCGLSRYTALKSVFARIRFTAISPSQRSRSAPQDYFTQKKLRMVMDIF